MSDRSEVLEDVPPWGQELLRRSRVIVSELFVGFLYAAGANTILAYFAQLPPACHSLKSILIVLGMLLFLGVDWMSHYRIRLQIPDDLSPLRTALKFCLDIATVFFLTLACSRVVASFAPSPTTALPLRPLGGTAIFGCFALVSGLWNVFALQLMKYIGIGRLLMMAIGGDLTAATNLLSKYNSRRAEKFERLISRGKGPSEGSAFLYAVSGGTGRAVSRALAFHVGISNLLVGSILLARTWAPQILAWPPHTLFGHIVTLVVLPLAALVISVACSIPEVRFCGIIASLAWIVALTWLYLNQESRWLVIIIAAEQVIATACLQLSVFTQPRKLEIATDTNSND